MSAELHAFDDAFTQGIGAAVYSVIRQPPGFTQRLVAAKARLAKQGLTVPRLELVSAYAATNLVVNKVFLNKRLTAGWTAWLYCTGFAEMGNTINLWRNECERLENIHAEIQWRHVPTRENPADLASRGGPVSGSPIWWDGPE
jgi:hypothetical protein